MSKNDCHLTNLTYTPRKGVYVLNVRNVMD